MDCRKIGVKYATYAVVLACTVLTYGGVSVFIVAFSVYPMAISLFKQANFPRRFIPAKTGPRFCHIYDDISRLT